MSSSSAPAAAESASGVFPTAAAVAVLLVVPGLWLWAAGGDGILGRPELDLVGHLWTIWNGGRDAVTTTSLVAYPHGADLMPILGGWLDVLVGIGLVRLGVPLGLAWNLVCALWLLLAGLGGRALARVVGASRPAAVLCGLLVQLDGYTIHHLLGGRTEQAGLGLVALAVAGAVHIWRRPGWIPAVATGVAGAAVVYVSWELAVLLTGAMAVLSLGICTSPAAPGAWRRFGVAAGTTALVAGPWSALFVARAAAVRSLHEGRSALLEAIPESVGLIGWLWGDDVRPSRLALAAVLLLPVTGRPSHRRLGIAVAGLLVLAWLLAAGPTPGLWSPGDLGLRRGLWSGYQALPFFGWFHTPRRTLVAMSLAAPVAAALLTDAVGRIHRLAAVGAAVALLGAAGVQLSRAQWRPAEPWEVVETGPLAELAQGPQDGALLDLPVVEPGAPARTYQRDQLTHGHPIPYHMTLERLTPARGVDIYQALGLARWLAGSVGPTPDADIVSAELHALSEQGYTWVRLHKARLPPGRFDTGVDVLTEALGKPDVRYGRRWSAWRLPPSR